LEVGQGRAPKGNRKSGLCVGEQRQLVPQGGERPISGLEALAERIQDERHCRRQGQYLWSR